MKATKDESLLTKKQAKEMLLVKKGMVHTFYNMPFGLLGGDHSKKSVLDDIGKAFNVKRTGEIAQSMGHGLVIIPSKECNQSDLLFVETKVEKKK